MPATAQSVISTQQNPTYSFSTPGLKSVTLQACNVKGCTSITKTVLVLDPMPAVTSASANPTSAEVGQLVHLTGDGKGQPALTYTWKILAGVNEVTRLGGASAWWSTAGLPPGIYTAILEIRNASGVAESLPRLITVAPSTGLDFYTLLPCRVFDSRSGAPLSSGVPRLINVVGSGCGIPANARSVALNVTVVGATGAGHVSLYPGNYPEPSTSTVNFTAGVVRANDAVLPIATDGTGTLAATAVVSGNGIVDVIVDASGYFAPTP